MKGTPEGKVMTVLGPVDAAQLGVTLPHEHLFQDLTAMFAEPEDEASRQFAQKPVTAAISGRLRLAPLSNLDNLVSNDENGLIAEASEYRAAGGGAIVDCTPANLGRNPDGLARVSRATGLHIVMGCGYYRESTLSPDVSARSVADIADELIRDVCVGVGACGVRAGLIGEIGCSYPLGDTEKKVLAAAAQAQQRTGAPVSIHPGHAEDSTLEIAEFLKLEGADLGRTIMCHVDISARTEATRRELAQTGCYIEYDHLGRKEYYFPNAWTTDLPDDRRRAVEIMQLIDWGYLDQILISHDVGVKSSRSTYGGIGYAHLLENFIPLMWRLGVVRSVTEHILVENPARAFAFAAASGAQS